MDSGTTLRARPARRTARGFTLIELLVVMAVIIILASLALPTLIRSISSTEAAKCLTQIRQIGFAYQSYLRDNDFWMACAGNQIQVHYNVNDTMIDSKYKMPQEIGSPTYEVPWFGQWQKFAYDTNFRYWYEVLQPYANPSATVRAAKDNYKARTGQDFDATYTNPQPALRVEQARVMGITACPSKRDTPVGYGYHYNAPFGNVWCYPNASYNFLWPRFANDTVGSSMPINVVNNKPTAIPVLWYGQSISFGTITQPSNQIVFCDTGKIKITSATLPTLSDPRRWIEWPDNNDEGYVRFPLKKEYWDLPCPVQSYWANPWRPVPRHAGRTACLFFDNSARTVPILDVVNPGTGWGDPTCMFDNKPPYRPPVSPTRWAP